MISLYHDIHDIKKKTTEKYSEFRRLYTYMPSLHLFLRDTHTFRTCPFQRAWQQQPFLPVLFCWALQMAQGLYLRCLRDASKIQLRNILGYFSRSRRLDWACQVCKFRFGRHVLAGVPAKRYRRCAFP
jgi:hypothetical protein